MTAPSRSEVYMGRAEKCETCAWWLQRTRRGQVVHSSWGSETAKFGIGDCRRYAPAVWAHKGFGDHNTMAEFRVEPHAVTSFAQTRDDDWCGEHRPKG